MDDILYVVENSKNVFINNDKISGIVNNIKCNDYSHWSKKIDVISSLNERKKVLFSFILESLNFCFWNSYEWKITYHNIVHLGSDALLYALVSIVENNYLKLDLEFLKSITYDMFYEMLSVNGKVPALMKERFDSFKTTIFTIINYPDFFRKLNSIKGAYEMEIFLSTTFTNFCDKSIYKKKTIVFNKRCRLLINDLFNVSRTIHSNIKDINCLLGCADYSIPRYFRELGIFDYSKELANKIDSKKEILHNSSEEVEIRGCTLYVIETIKKYALKKGIIINSLELDNILWRMSRKIKKTNSHHTISIYY